jgi:hypothetical protein
VSTAKRELQAQLERIAAIEAVAIEVNAIGYDEDNDDTSSNDDPDAEMQLYARAFQAWADGKISGTAEEIFDAVNAVLED